MQIYYSNIKCDKFVLLVVKLFIFIHIFLVIIIVEQYSPFYATALEARSEFFLNF